MADRLREPERPEIVVVNPETTEGWLEEEVMGSARAQLPAMISRADEHGRFRLGTPVTGVGAPIYVHAKLRVIDDRLLKVGSSNLNIRSLGFDTECDLSIEPREEDADLRARILNPRHYLIAEHLGVEATDIKAAIGRSGGSLIGAIEVLRSEAARSSHPTRQSSTKRRRRSWPRTTCSTRSARRAGFLTSADGSPGEPARGAGAYRHHRFPAGAPLAK